jgi:hypothetical protein
MITVWLDYPRSRALHRFPCIIRSAPSAPVAGQQHEVLVAATPRRISSPHNKITSVSAGGAGQRPPWLGLGAYWA